MATTEKAEKIADDGSKEKRIRSYDPLALAIVGGKCLDEEEQGPLDTFVDVDDELHDAGLMAPLDESFVLNIDAFGVHTPVKVRIRDGIPFIVFGRHRVRAARRINRKRVATGQPIIRVDATVEVSKDERRIMGVMFSENAARLTRGFAETVANLRRYMERGVSIEDAAMTFNMDAAKAKSWVDFDDNAIDVVRDYVHRDIMSVSAGIEIMRAGGPDKQRAVLVALFEDMGLISPVDPVAEVANPRPMQKVIDEANANLDARAARAAETKSTRAKVVGARAARQAAKRVTAPTKNAGIGDKRTMTKLLAKVRDKSMTLKAQRTLDFFEGAENMLTLILGGDEGKETDERLVELLKEVRKEMQKGKPK